MGYLRSGSQFSSILSLFIHVSCSRRLLPLFFHVLSFTSFAIHPGQQLFFPFVASRHIWVAFWSVFQNLFVVRARNSYNLILLKLEMGKHHQSMPCVDDPLPGWKLLMQRVHWICVLCFDSKLASLWGSLLEQCTSFKSVTWISNYLFCNSKWIISVQFSLHNQYS